MEGLGFPFLAVKCPCSRHFQTEIGIEAVAGLLLLTQSRARSPAKTNDNLRSSEDGLDRRNGRRNFYCFGRVIMVKYDADFIFFYWTIE